nr:hypothetical protein [Beggiatoa leptomitoformis]
MPRPLPLSVDVLGIAHVQGFQRTLQTVVLRGNGDKVNVVGH